jgi:hypothetical protein
MDVITRVRQRIWKCISGAPWAASEVENNAKENNITCALLPGIYQAFVFAHLKRRSILQYHGRSGNLEIVRLQEYIHRIFPEVLHQRKREDKLKI